MTTDLFGTDLVQCSGAQMVRTDFSLLVWAICAPNGAFPSTNLSISLRRSVDWGTTWEPAVPQPFPPPSLPTVIYDPRARTLVSIGVCGADETGAAIGGSAGECHLPRAATCSWRSTDDGKTWVGPRHLGNLGGNEGCGGVALESTGRLLAPARGLPNCTQADSMLVSDDAGETWYIGGPTPVLPSKQAWGEAMIAEAREVESQTARAMPSARDWQVSV